MEIGHRSVGVKSVALDHAAGGVDQRGDVPIRILIDVQALG